MSPLNITQPCMTMPRVGEDFLNTQKTGVAPGERWRYTFISPLLSRHVPSKYLEIISLWKFNTAMEHHMFNK